MLVEEDHCLLVLQPLAVCDGPRYRRETLEIGWLELRGPVNAVGRGCLDVDDHVVIARVVETRLEASERRRRLAGTAVAGDQHATPATPDRSSMHWLQRRRHRPPVEQGAQGQARLPPRHHARRRTPVDPLTT